MRAVECHLLLCASLALQACAGAPRPRPDPRDDQEFTGLPPTVTGEIAAAAPSPALGSISSGTIRRPDYDQLLAGPPGAFLALVPVTPAFESRRFIGWRIEAFFPGDPRLARVDVRVGDVVLRINGKSIEHPEQFIEVWREARGLSELRVDLLRDGLPRRLSFSIVE